LQLLWDANECHLEFKVTFAQERAATTKSDFPAGQALCPRMCSPIVNRGPTC